MVYVVYIEKQNGDTETFHVEMSHEEAATLRDALYHDVDHGILAESFVGPPENLAIPLGDVIQVIKKVVPGALKKRWAP